MVVFDTWRAELVAELEAARMALAAAAAGLATAEAAAAEGRRARRDLAEAVARLGRGVDMAGPLQRRWAELENKLRTTGGPTTRIRNEARFQRELIRDLELALQQLDIMTPPPPPPVLEASSEPLLSGVDGWVDA